MAWTRSTLAGLRDALNADVDTRLDGAAGELRRAVRKALVPALAAAVFALEGFIAWISAQIFPDTAEAENLERWAGVWGVAREAATGAAGTVTLSGNDGVEIPAGTLLQRADGERFATDALATVAGGAATVAVTAVADGDSGNSEAGEILDFVSPVAGADATATVAAGGLLGGADAESDASLRTRLLERIQQPPHGGADFDYRAWALDRAAHGIDTTRVWVAAGELGPGTVSVRFMMDDDYADGLPLAADVAAVQAHIDSQRPVTADVTVLAPVAAPLNFTISGLDPNTQAVKDAIGAELKDLLRREAAPGGTILLSHIREAISIAAGETDHALDAPAADVAHATGEIATFGSVTWL